ncbi:hypothetical protein BC940DRAFT_293936 [Gongronella butleri]|nr:hypothetical protein BC940DRAFT_293936 [Gongronella butleri]
MEEFKATLLNESDKIVEAATGEETAQDTMEDVASFEAQLKPSHTASIAPRIYLDKTVVPVLLEGMKLLVAERPENALEYLGKFLLDKSQQQAQNHE